MNAFMTKKELVLVIIYLLINGVLAFLSLSIPLLKANYNLISSLLVVVFLAIILFSNKRQPLKKKYVQMLAIVVITIVEILFNMSL